MIIKTKRRINIILFTPVLIILLIACNNQKAEHDIIQTDDSSVLIPMDNVSFSTVNMTDENGLKQGTWQEDDQEEGRLVYSITKEYNFKNDTLHGYYLEYKTKSDDTLIYGHYFKGKKHGEWKYWATDKNQIEKVEIYNNDKLVK
jgi:hypothetical protein